MLEFKSLSASSKGNAWLVKKRKRYLLIDLGISYKKLEEYFYYEGLDLEQIAGICVSHEHSDHSRGLVSLQKNLNLPIYCNFLTAESLCETYNTNFNCNIFTNEEEFEIEDFKITPFSIPHDASDPVAFKICAEEEKLAICTDLGYAHKGIYHQLQKLNALVIESNHDLQLLAQSKRPPRFKQRVLSRNGHISNETCAQIISQVQHSKLHTIVLSHLSEDCNRPELALNHATKSINKSVCTPSIDFAPLTSPSRWFNCQCEESQLMLATSL